MAINFPATSGQPTDGSYTHTVGNITWLWDGLTWRSGVSSSTNESDPIFTSSAAGSITSTHIANWNEAYSWGQGGNGASVTTSDTAPTSPSDGDLWWQSDTGYLKIYYNDGDSNQWVDASPGGNGSGGGGGGISLASLSVTSNSVGTAALTYNNTNGVFSYTPPDLSAYLTSLGDAAGVTTTKITYWDTAYGWGDHANSGYITSYTEVDTLDTVTGRGATTTNNIGVGNLTTTGVVIDDANVQINRDGSGTLKIAVAGSNHLDIYANVTTMKAGSSADKTALKLTSPGAVELYYDSNKKFETTTNGVTITGALTAGGLTYPTTNGTNDQVLSSDGAGNVQWVDQSSGSPGQIYSIAVTAPSSSVYNLSGIDRLGSVSGDNASITVNEGDTIEFVLSSGASHPFYIRDTSGGTSVSNPTVSNQGATSGQVSWTPQISNGGSVGSYVYQCGNHSGMVGTITVRARNTVNEIDTLDSVTGRGATTTNNIGVGNLTATGVTVSGTVTDSKGDLRTIPINSHTANYTLLVSDAGTVVSIDGASGAVDITIPNAIFSAGQMITILNNGGQDVNIIQGTSTTVRYTDTGNSGNRTMDSYSSATILVKDSNLMYVSGTRFK